jgi:hypothetical protein
MPQPKGSTGNPNGRKPGTPNKLTASMREKVNLFLAGNWEQVQADYNELEPKERLIFYEKILSYSLPKLQSTTLEANVNTIDKVDSFKVIIEDKRENK